LCGAHSQGCEACGPAGRTIEQVRAGDQPPDRPNAGPHRAADAAIGRRRGDRMIGRREFITLVGGAAAAWPIAARAQQKRIPRLCFLTFDPGTLRTRSPRFNGFFQGLQDLGYANARNIEISYLSADNNGDRFPALIDECLSLRPDVIAVTTTPA